MCPTPVLYASSAHVTMHMTRHDICLLVRGFYCVVLLPMPSVKSDFYLCRLLRPARPARPTSYLVAKGGQIDGGPAASFQSPFSTFAYISHVMISLSNSVGELFTKMAHMRIYLVVGVPPILILFCR